MKNSKRMMAAVAAAGLAMGTLPGVANAQDSSDLLDLGLGLQIGESVELGLDLGLGSLAPEGDADFGSLIPEEGSLSDSLSEGSLGDGDGSLSDSLGEGSLDGGDGSLSDSLGEGSLGDGDGSLSDSLGDDDSSLADGSLGIITGSLEPEQDGDGEPGSLEEIFEDLDFGSLIPDSDSLGSEEGDGSLEGGSLEDIFSGSADGSNGNGPDPDPGNDDNDENGSAEIDAEVLLAVGSLAAAGIAAGVAVSGGVDLPPLPDVNVGLVCELPQEGIDFLKGNGSMEQDECEPEEQN